MQPNRYQPSIPRRIQGWRKPRTAEDANSYRRAQNVQIIALGLVGLALALMISVLIHGTTGHTLAILIGCAVIFATGGMLAVIGRPELGALLLNIAVLAAVVIAVADANQLQAAPYFVSVSLVIAGMTMRPRGVAVTLIGALATLAVVSALGATTAQIPLPPGSLILNATLMAGTVALLAILDARGAADTQRTVREREQETLQAEQALHESEERYSLIAEHSSDLIALLDADGCHLYASPSYGRVLGLALVTLIGTKRCDLIHPEDLAIVTNHWHQARARGSAQASYRVARADGSWCWIETRLTSVRRQSEDYIVLVGRDITERRAFEEQLQQAQKLEALGRLAGGIAHDFNNLLTVINSSIELTAGDLHAGHPAHQDLVAAKEAGQRAATLTRQLLAFARRQIIRHRSINLASVVRDLNPLLERLIGGNIRVISEFAPDICDVIADPAQIEQVIMNLAVNARDAMPDGGTLTITVANASYPADPSSDAAAPVVKATCLTITDTGSGMSDEVQRHLFEPFFTTKAPGQGTGLGLAICYGIVTQSGGTISVASTSGCGTSFIIRLPCADLHAHELAEALARG